MWTYTYNNELYHHGIKGQKWGVRRYQNADGSLTNKGRNRYSNETDHAKKSFDKKKAAKIATGVAVTALATYAISNPKIRNAAAGLAKKSAKKIAETANDPKVKAFIKEKGTKTIKSLDNSFSKAGKAMTDAALVSIGTIQISKLNDRLATDNNASEAVKNRNKIILDAGTAGIKSLTNSGGSNSSGKSGGNNKSVGKEVSDAIGQPSKKSIDKSSGSWQNLFKDSNGNQRDNETRSTIKSLAAAGYDIDQIDSYLKKLDNGSIRHSDIDTYAISGEFYVHNVLIL